MIERKDIEERSKNRMGISDFGGRSTWETYEVENIILSDETLNRNWESWSANFNRKIRDGTFNEEKAKEVLSKYLLKEVKKRDEYDDIDVNMINMDELLDDTILMNDPLPPRKKDHAPKNVYDYQIEGICFEKNMEFVPGYYKDDGTYVRGYCRHTKFTEYMREKRMR